jgi:hypothetical protein
LKIKKSVLIRFIVKIFFLFIIIFSSFEVSAQNITITGTVFDITKKTPIAYVSVLSTSGKGTATDSTGQYKITVKETDSIYFSFLNKETPKYPVTTIRNPDAFDISIMKKIQELPTVFVKQRNYRMDSLQNRLDYQKIFDYSKPGIGTTINPGLAVGLDINQFINMFNFRKNKRMVGFQKRLLNEEKEKFISHRFNKGLVTKLTGLRAPAIDSFMAEFRPTLEMTQQFNDLEFGQFIVEAYKYYKAGVKIDKTAFRKEME